MPYRANAATVGNSKGLRLDAALFRAHPEFAAGAFTVSVIAPGRMLVQTAEEAPGDDSDPVLDAWLGFVEHQMAQRPDLISAVTLADRLAADKILRGVPFSASEDLGADFVLPGSRPVARPAKRVKAAAKKK